jgi:uncharacterized protein (DUF433 family)
VTVSLLDRRVYGLSDVDRLLALPPGTARRYGRPVVRAVPTEVVAEQFRAGESTEMIADLFDLTVAQVEQALRFELNLARTA